MSGPQRVDRREDDASIYRTESLGKNQRPSAGGRLSSTSPLLLPLIIVRNLFSRLYSFTQIKKEKLELRNKIGEQLHWIKNDKKIQSFLNLFATSELKKINDLIKNKDIRKILEEKTFFKEFEQKIIKILKIPDIIDKISLLEPSDRTKALEILLKSEDYSVTIEGWSKADTRTILNLSHLEKDVARVNSLLGDRLSPKEMTELKNSFLKSPDSLPEFLTFVEAVNDLQQERPVVYTHKSKKASDLEELRQKFIRKLTGGEEHQFADSISKSLRNTVVLSRTEILHEGMQYSYLSPEKREKLPTERLPQFRVATLPGELSYETNYSFSLPTNDEEEIDFNGFREVHVVDHNGKNGLINSTVRQTLPFDGKMPVKTVRSLNELLYKGTIEDPSSFEYTFWEQNLNYENLPENMKKEIDAFKPNAKQKNALAKEYYEMKENFYKNIKYRYNDTEEIPDFILLELVDKIPKDKYAAIAKNKKALKEALIREIDSYLSYKIESANTSSKTPSEMSAQAKQRFDSIFTREELRDEKAKLYLHNKFYKFNEESNLEITRTYGEFNDASRKGKSIEAHPQMEEFIGDATHDQQVALNAAQLGNIYLLNNGQLSLLPRQSSIDSIVTLDPINQRKIAGSLIRGDSIKLKLPSSLKNKQVIESSFTFQAEEVKLGDNERFLEITTTQVGEKGEKNKERKVLYPMGNATRKEVVEDLVTSRLIERDYLLALSRFLFEGS